jgi:tetratricopeptide (TPR) repeat protein
VTLSPDIARQQIITLLQSNQPANAKQLCLQLVQRSADPQVLVLLANAQVRLGELDAAINTLREVTRPGQGGQGALVLLTALLLTRGRHADADKCFATLSGQLADAEQAHLQVARTLRQLGNRAAAAEYYRTAWELDPDNQSCLFEYAATLQECGQLKDAVQCYERYLAASPDNVQAMINLAMCHGAGKQFDSAVEVLEACRKLAPSNPAVHFHLGEAYQQQNRYPPAIASYRRALELSPGSAALYGSLARAQRNLGDLAGAEKNLRLAQSLEPGNATIFNDLGICLYRDDDLQPALQAFTEAVRLNPTNALSRFYLGMVCSQGGDQQAAEEQFAHACQQWSYLESFVDSWRYARQAGPGARYFCTSRQIFEHAVQQAADDGLFLEFGVYFGTSINIIAGLTQNTVHGFDTFQGLPNDWMVERGEQRDVEAAGSYSTHGVLPEAPANVRYHVGTFEDTLPGFCSEHAGPVSFMNIDCDLYESTRTIFDFMGGQVRPGSVIVFDEYFCLAGWRDHEYKAFQEFIRSSGLSYDYLAFNFFSGQVAVRIRQG